MAVVGWIGQSSCLQYHACSVGSSAKPLWIPAPPSPLYMHVEQRDSPPQRPPPTITGQIVPMMGRRCLKIQLWLAKIKNGCILGLDLLTKVGAMLDLARGTMHLSRDRLLLTPFPEKELQDRGNTGVPS
ncbi:hypothetical protein EOD39_13534 [Acipenser ruthenus]|uniref:Uncharacterized protein n=1 Tax=Acipenser ruthenus TaxID=7906 RepID=A0A662YPN0_ACIRT|nr:hypothetical protein EOD39_13534 [Acipenser ruthenus]